MNRFSLEMFKVLSDLYREWFNHGYRQPQLGPSRTGYRDSVYLIGIRSSVIFFVSAFGGLKKNGQFYLHGWIFYSIPMSRTCAGRPILVDNVTPSLEPAPRVRALDPAASAMRGLKVGLE